MKHFSSEHTIGRREGSLSVEFVCCDGIVCDIRRCGFRSFGRHRCETYFNNVEIFVYRQLTADMTTHQSAENPEMLRSVSQLPLFTDNAECDSRTNNVLTKRYI